MGKEVPSGVEPYRDSDGTKDRTVEVASHEVSGGGHRPPRQVAQGFECAEHGLRPLFEEDVWIPGSCPSDLSASQLVVARQLIQLRPE